MSPDTNSNIVKLQLVHRNRRKNTENENTEISEHCFSVLDVLNAMHGLLMFAFNCFVLYSVLCFPAQGPLMQMIYIANPGSTVVVVVVVVRDPC